MKIIENELECVGCGACVYSCPKQCITMQKKNSGFWYPVVNHENCINCGKCKKICPINKEKQNIKPLSSYAVFEKNNDQRLKSASGGASSILAKEIIREHGYFCGARFNEDMSVVHDVTYKMNDLDEYKDSKYVQSDFQYAWSKIGSALKENRKILVAGTPCQIAAVKSVFGNNENLVTCDLICSGVPDPGIFKLYLEDLEKQNGKEIVKFYFRDKTNGWRKSNIKIKFLDGTNKIYTRDESYYFKLFGANLFFRECCYKCKFKNFNIYSDFTIGDYWGIEKKLPNIDDKGCSVVIVNTEKGKKYFENIKDKCVFEKTDIDFAIETHPKLIRSIEKSPYRGLFYHIYNTENISKLKKATKVCISQSIVDKIKRHAYNAINKSKGEKND